MELSPKRTSVMLSHMVFPTNTFNDFWTWLLATPYFQKRGMRSKTIKVKVEVTLISASVTGKAYRHEAELNRNIQTKECNVLSNITGIHRR